MLRLARRLLDLEEWIDPVSGSADRNRWLVPGGLGLLVLAAGFVALTAFSIWGDYPRDLPGLWSYRSATYGDGIALPLLAGLLPAGVRSPRLPQVPVARWGWLGAAAGFCVGVATQALWLRDPQPHLNWTLPAPHRFTTAGWWHAVFLSLMAALLSGLWVALLVKLHAASREDERALRSALDSAGSAWIIACVLFFTILLALDNRGATDSQAGLTTAVAVASVGVVLLVTLTMACGAITLAVLPAAAVGIGLAGAGIVVVLQAPSMLVPTAFALLTAVGGAFATTRETPTLDQHSAQPTANEGHRERRRWWESYGVAVLYVLGMTLWLDDRHNSLAVALALPLLAGLGALALRHIRTGRAGLTQDFVVCVGSSVVLLATSRVAIWLQQEGVDALITAGFALTVSGVLLGRLLFPHVQEVYRVLIESERQLAGMVPRRLSDEGQRAIAAKAWQRVSGFGVAAISALLLLTIAVGPSLGFVAGAGQPHQAVLYQSVALICIALAAPAAWQAAQLEARLRHVAAGENARSSKLILLSCLACAVWLAASIGFAWPLHLRWQAVPLMQALLVGFFTAESLVTSHGILQRVRPSKQHWIGAGLCGVAVAAGDFALVTAGIRDQGGAVTVNWSLGMLVVVFACNIVLVLGMGNAVVLVDRLVAARLATRPQHLRTYPLPAMVAQDLGLSRLLVLFAMWLPMLALAHVGAGAPERWAAIASLIAGFQLLLGPAFFWVLGNNINHIAIQRAWHNVPAQTPRPPVLRRLQHAAVGLVGQLGNPGRNNREGEDHIEALEGHIYTQNALAFAIVGLTVVGALVYINDAPYLTGGERQ